MCSIMDWSGFQMPFKNWMVDPLKTGYFGLVFKCHSKTKQIKHPVFEFFRFSVFEWSKTRPLKVEFSNVTRIQISGLRFPTVLYNM